MNDEEKSNNRTKLGNPGVKELGKEKQKDQRKNDPELQKLAKRIRNLRIKNGYSNADYFAYEHNITRTQYNRYENGENIKYSSLLKLIKAFGMTPKEFFSEGFD